MTLRQLVDEAQAIKDDRESIETELKAVKCDMAGKFLSELMQTGTMNEAAICSQQLDRMYGPLRERVAQSLKRQDTVLRQLKESCTEFGQLKAQGSTSNPREKQLRDLAMAYDSFIELKNNIEEGAQFYNELTEMLIKCQSKIAEFCSARDAEKEDLLQDLSVNMPHHPSSPPAHMMTQSHYSQPLQIPAFYQQPQQQPAGITRGMNRVTIGSGPPAAAASHGGMYGGHSATFYTLGMRSQYNPYAQPSSRTFQWH